MERKISVVADYNQEKSDFSDIVVLMSANVEDAYIKAGIDYTAKECFDKGFELARSSFERKIFSASLKLKFLN